MRHFLAEAIFLFLAAALFAEQRETTLLYPPFKHTWGIHRGSEAKLDMILGDVTDFDNPQGIAVTRLKSTDDRASSDDDDEVTCFGVNANRGQIIYNASMKALKIYGSKGTGKDKLLNPRGICATEDGNVYVADMGNKRIVHLRIKNNVLVWVKSFGETYLDAPFDVKYIAGDTLYITDTGRNSIIVADSSGKKIDEFTGFVAPRGLDIETASQRWCSPQQNEEITVVDFMGMRITKLDRFTGKVRKRITCEKIGFPKADMQFLSIDYRGNVYVADSLNCKIHKFDGDLNHIVSYGKCGTQDEQFDRPRGIAIWRRFGQIFVSERSGAQYFWIGVDVRDFKVEVDEKARRISFNFFVTEDAYINVAIEGKGVDKNLGRRKKVSIGKQSITYELPPDIPVGTYNFKLDFEATYSSYKHFVKTITRNKLKI